MIVMTTDYDVITATLIQKTPMMHLRQQIQTVTAPTIPEPVDTGNGDNTDNDDGGSDNTDNTGGDDNGGGDGDNTGDNDDGGDSGGEDDSSYQIDYYDPSPESDCFRQRNIVTKNPLGQVPRGFFYAFNDIFNNILIMLL